MALLALASIGLWAGFFGPIQVLLAQQAEAIDAANKEQVLALVTGARRADLGHLQPAGRRLLRPDDAARRPPAAVARRGALGGALSLAVLSVAPTASR